jgi:uncharacterized iron-regulated membrane protein
VSGLFLVILSLSGSVLLYAKDIQHLIEPHNWRVTAQNTLIDHASLIENVEKTTQQKIIRFMPEKDPTLAWQYRLSNDLYASVNPYTGQVINTYEYESTIYGFTIGLHRWLLYKDDNGKRPFRNWVSICASLLIINLLVGFYIWVKPKNRIKRLAIKPKAKLRVLLYQLHTVVGVYVFIPLLLIAFAGISFNWKQVTQPVVEFVTLGKVESRPKAPKIKSDPLATPNYNLAIHNALNTFRQGELFRIYLPKAPSDAIALRIQNPGESMAYSWVWVHPNSGEVLQQYDASKANLSTHVWNFKYKFHTGGFAGPIVQFIWLLIVLSLSFFVISGIYFWCKRHKWI